MMTKSTKLDLVRRFIALGPEQAEEVDELVTPDFKIIPYWYAPQPWPGVTSDLDDLAFFKKNLKAAANHFSDEKIEYQELFEAGEEWIVAVFTSKSKFRLKTDTINYNICLFQIREGKISSILRQWDRLGFFQQIGILPSQAELRQKLS